MYGATALNLASRNIRLVELQPVCESDPFTIKCSLQCFSLSTCPPYVALSYTWGPANHLKEIQINNCRFMIRENLWWFLYHMRLRSQGKLLWIDALCIDQSNIMEKNHQVPLMRQIYGNAASVAVWLGQAADDSDIAMDYIRDKGPRPLKQKRSGLRNIWNSREGNAVLALCERRYWRRIWIVQEIM
ncbi:HET-domain-containing protein, partial [Glonium stellatum]